MKTVAVIARLKQKCLLALGKLNPKTTIDPYGLLFNYSVKRVHNISEKKKLRKNNSKEVGS